MVGLPPDQHYQGGAPAQAQGGAEPGARPASKLSSLSLDLCEQTAATFDLPAVTRGSHLAEVKEVYNQREERGRRKS